jgi:hypothetical protein
MGVEPVEDAAGTGRMIGGASFTAPDMLALAAVGGSWGPLPSSFKSSSDSITACFFSPPAFFIAGTLSFLPRVTFGTTSSINEECHYSTWLGMF